jgi:hypothetical protein
VKSKFWPDIFFGRGSGWVAEKDNRNTVADFSRMIGMDHSMALRNLNRRKSPEQIAAIGGSKTVLPLAA